MSDSKIALDVVTPRGRLLGCQVDEIVLPGLEGYLGVRPGHTPLLLGLGIGVLSWYNRGEKGRAAVASGYAEIGPDSVAILAELAELPDEIDKERAQAALKRSTDRLARTEDNELNLDRARAAQLRASTRLDVCQDRGKSGAPGR